MLLNIESAKKDSGRAFTARFEEIPSCPEFPISYEIVKPVVLETEYTYAEGEVLCKGSFTAVIKVMCSRCLKEFEYDAACSFEERFAPALSDEVSYTIVEDAISFDKLVLDYIHAELPQSFLCKEDCKGLCPVCGKDLNEADCGCIIDNEIKTINPFSKLEGLFNNEEV